MARRDALYRFVFAILYLPLYYFILYPLVFFLGIGVTAIDVLFSTITGRSLEVKPRAASNAWQGISKPVTWVFSGETRDKPGWLP